MPGTAFWQDSAKMDSFPKNYGGDESLSHWFAVYDQKYNCMFMYHIGFVI